MIGKVQKNCTLRLKNSRLMSCLSLSTMFLLVLACIVLITSVEVTPILLLGLGQIAEGQRDVILTPKGVFLNATAVEQLIQLPVMPRISLNFLMQEKFGAGTAWLMDFTKEKAQHLGTIGGDQPAGHNYAYVSEDYDVPLESEIHIHVFHSTLWEFLRQKIYKFNDTVANQQYDTFSKAKEKKGKFIVKQKFGFSMGKFGQGNTNGLIYLDILYAMQQIINTTLQEMNINPKQLLSYLPKDALGQFSSQATINMPDRLKVFSQANQQDVYRDLIGFAYEINKKIGLFALNTNSPIATNLKVLKYFGMFIGMLLKLVIVCLFVLSSLMMANMLQIAADTKHFQFAVIKLIGAGRFTIAFNLVFNCFKYILLSNLLAYPLATYILSVISDTFSQLFGYRYDISPSLQSILGAVIIGICVPLVASFLPLYNILNNDLAENLNPTRNKVTAIYTEVYVQGQQFPWGKVLFGCLTASYGLMIYYLLPKALINQSLQLLLAIFFLILMGLLVGLIIMGFAIQYILQKAIAYLTLFWADKTDFTLTLKNLSAHRIKNRRTSLLYAVSVAFIVFISVGLDIQLQTVKMSLFATKGTYLEIYNVGSNFTHWDQVLGTTAGVQSWSSATDNIQDEMIRRGELKAMYVSDKAKSFFKYVRVMGVSDNFVDTFIQPIPNPVWTDATSPYTPYSYLSSPKGYMTCIISAELANNLHVTQGGNRDILLNFYYEDKIVSHTLRVSSIYDKFAGFFYGRLMGPNMAVSYQTYRTLGGFQSHEDLHISVVKVKVEEEQVEKVSKELRGKGASVWDYLQLNSTLQQIKGIISTVDKILLILVLTISFFSLLTTSFINVMNQYKEIGILLTLGYSKIRIVKVYIYEAFVLVLNSCLLGAVVGYIVAVMMALQRELFFDGQIKLQLDWISTLFIAAILSSVLSSIQPLRSLFALPLTQVLKQA